MRMLYTPPSAPQSQRVSVSARISFFKRFSIASAVNKKRHETAPLPGAPSAHKSRLFAEFSDSDVVVVKPDKGRIGLGASGPLGLPRADISRCCRMANERLLCCA
jgi:hypothetical protein